MPSWPARPTLGFVVALAALAPALARAQEDTALAARVTALGEAGRPWHATRLFAVVPGDRASAPAAVVAEADAELVARRYEDARRLLSDAPWLETYDGGAALTVLAAAEARLGLFGPAAAHFTEAEDRATGPAAAVLAVRAAAAWEAFGVRDSAARLYAAARGVLPGIEPWLRVREARVTRDTVRAFALLAGAPGSVGAAVPAARAGALLAAGDTTLAIDAYRSAGRALDAGFLALAHQDSARARAALYAVMDQAPEGDAAAAAAAVVLERLPPEVPRERVALARALRLHGGAAAALPLVERAVQDGDSSGPALLLLGDLWTGVGRGREAAAVYEAAARDSSVAPLARYRWGRVLLRVGDPGARTVLASVVERYPADTVAPAAAAALAEAGRERGDDSSAAYWIGVLWARYPADLRSSVTRLRLAAAAFGGERWDSATALYQAEVASAGPQRLAARYWLGKVAFARGDTVGAESVWTVLAHEDSLSYYGLRARERAGLPALTLLAAPDRPTPPEAAQGLATLDTLVAAGLDSEAQMQVASLLANPPPEPDALLAWSEGLAARGYGPAAVHLAWQAAERGPRDAAVLRAIYPWPDRVAVEAEAREFAVDPWLLVAIVRQESVFDPEASSTAGARGLTQLLPSTAAQTARGLAVTFDPGWLTLPDLNLHLGAAHLATLLSRLGRVDAAVAAYDAGVPPVRRWLARPGGSDPDTFVELIPYDETRGYVRAVLRNRILYRALYGSSTD